MYYFQWKSRTNLPDDIEKFIISPPELDMVAQWVKNAQAAMEAQMREQFEAQQNASSSTSEQETQQEKPDSGIWTPN